MTILKAFACNRCGVTEMRDQGTKDPDDWCAVAISNYVGAQPYGTGGEWKLVQLCPKCTVSFDIWATGVDTIVV